MFRIAAKKIQSSFDGLSITERLIIWQRIINASMHTYPTCKRVTFPPIFYVAIHFVISFVSSFFFFYSIHAFSFFESSPARSSLVSPDELFPPLLCVLRITTWGLLCHSMCVFCVGAVVGERQWVYAYAFPFPIICLFKVALKISIEFATHAQWIVIFIKWNWRKFFSWVFQ